MATSTQSSGAQSSILRRVMVLGLVAAMAGSGVAPAMAQGRDHDRHDRRPERGHWDRHPTHFYAPPVVVPPSYGSYYAPPPVVQAPPSGLSIVLPINIR